MQYMVNSETQQYMLMNSVVNNISPTVDIVDIIKQVYNFKAGE